MKNLDYFRLLPLIFDIEHIIPEEISIQDG
jgi:hypothetical protein